MSRTFDAVVVGSGPNGLAAAITIARAGRSVVVLEAEASLGGGLRSAELTLPGFTHDVCSTIHALGVVSPFFQSLPLASHGVEWVYPPAALAHPLEDGTVALLERSLEATSVHLGVDAAAYRRLMEPLVANVEDLFDQVLNPFQFPRNLPLALRFGFQAIQSAKGLVRNWFQGAKAKALFAGLAAHSVLPLEKAASAAAALVLGAAGHAVGWPLARGGSQRIADGLVAILRTLGGEVVTGRRVTSLADLPSARAVLFDVAPRRLIAICGDRLPAAYRRALGRFRHGPGVFKLDWALNRPIPWRAADCLQAATVHLGGTFGQISAAERQVWAGSSPQSPFVLLVQPSLFDGTRASAGKHTGWAYCHVPHGSRMDMTQRIELQVERFAPGFRDCILARHVSFPHDMERRNANLIGGDISGGVMDLWQLVARPVLSLDPYATPVPGWYLCSASTPPGSGVHGMCGFLAAQSALRHTLT